MSFAKLKNAFSRDRIRFARVGLFKMFFHCFLYYIVKLFGSFCVVRVIINREVIGMIVFQICVQILFKLVVLCLGHVHSFEKRERLFVSFPALLQGSFPSGFNSVFHPRRLFLISALSAQISVISKIINGGNFCDF